MTVMYQRLQIRSNQDIVRGVRYFGTDYNNAVISLNLDNRWTGVDVIFNDKGNYPGQQLLASTGQISGSQFRFPF